MEEKLITVIVPIYNSEKYLPECINSIINQTYKNLEIILVDDGSTDLSGKICNDYAKKDNRIKVIHKENSGVSSARNLGLDNANGKWISFVDADDWLENNFIELLYNETIKNEELDIVCSGYYRAYLNKKEKINCKVEKIKYQSQEYMLKLLNVQNGYGFCHMKLIRNDCIKNLRFNENIKVGEDALFNMQIVENINAVLILGSPLYNYRFNDNSVVRKFDPNYVDKYLKSILAVKEYIFKQYNNNVDIIRNYYNYVAYHILLIIVNYCFNSANNKKLIKKVKLLKTICEIEEFRIAIKKANYNDLSITRKITLFTIKHRLFFLTSLICIYRQYQFSK